MTREDLEAAARQYFGRLTETVDVPRSLSQAHLRRDIDHQVSLSDERAHDLENQLRANTFDADISKAAAELVAALGVSLPELPDHLRIVSLQLAARAQRQRALYHAHQLTSPASAFAADDRVFETARPTQVSATGAAGAASLAQGEESSVGGPTLREAIDDYEGRRKLRGLSQSQLDEVARVLNWLQEFIDPTTRLELITKDQVRGFRDDLQRIDVTLRGKPGAFRHRLTNLPENQIKSVTSRRYWSSVQAFFAWSVGELSLPVDPTVGLKVEKKKGEVRESPEPFTTDELIALFKTPLFAGYASLRSVKSPGDLRCRAGHWWAGVLPLFTGLRAGELSQLLPSDFVFDAEVPHLRVSEEDDEGARTKTAKNTASIRDVPLAPTLLVLGLRQFVEDRAKKYPKDRIFREFRLGARGRKSDGLTKFWSPYLKQFGLWKPGRSTHVARHTVVARLRALDVAQEDIAAFVGHSGGTVTAGYGGAYPLARKAKTADRLDYGFDVVAALGGAFDPKLHASP